MRVKTGARASLILRSVVRMVRPDTHRDNRTLRGRGKRGARLVFRCQWARGLLHDLRRACTYVRVPLVINDGVIGKVFYPVFPPDKNAEEVVAWLRASR